MHGGQSGLLADGHLQKLKFRPNLFCATTTKQTCLMTRLVDLNSPSKPVHQLWVNSPCQFSSLVSSQGPDAQTMAPYPCSCGRSFQSTGALAQHRAAKHGSQLPVQPQVQPQNSTAQLSTRNARSPPRNVRSRDSRLWRGVLNTGSIAEINSADLRPSRTPVSIATPSQLVCSYNWQCVGGFHVPGNTPRPCVSISMNPG